MQHVAIGRERGEATFYLVDDAPGHSGLRRKDSYPRGGAPREITVKVVPLDGALPESLRVQFIKADLEGGEFDALVGGRRILEDSRPVVVFESAIRADSRRYGYTVEEFFAYFENLEFDVCDILGVPFVPSHALNPYPFYLVAFPAERGRDVRAALSLALMDTTFSLAWFNGSESDSSRRM